MYVHMIGTLFCIMGTFPKTCNSPNRKNVENGSINEAVESS
jgi:hypothetical protein